MFLNEVLQLDKTQGSIKKIDLFLAQCKKNSLDYYKAYAYRNLILHSLNKTNEALKSLYIIVPNFKEMTDDEIVAICDAIISITFDVNRLDQAKKYIAIKKEHLKISNSTSNLIDEANYAIKEKDYSKSVDILNKLINDEISIDELCWAYENLAKVYYEIHNYAEFENVAAKLEKIYQDNLNTKKLIDLNYKRMELSFLEGKYIKVICDGNTLLNEYHPEDESKIKIVTLLIKSYLQSKDYRKAIIIESNYESLLSNVTSDTALSFCKACLELYTETNSLISLKHYQELVSTYEKSKKKPKTERNKDKNIVIPNIQEDETEEKTIERKKYINEVGIDVNTLYVSNNYIKLEKLFNIINNLDTNTKFREVYRVALIELSKYINFKEAFLVYYDSSYLGIHYKKERAYDKLLDFEILEDTINFLSLIKETEIYLDKDSTIGFKNIVTKEKYEDIPYAIALPMYKENVAFASIAFFSDEPFLGEELAYETLKLVTQMLNKALLNELNQNIIKANNRRMFFIYDNMSSGVKEMMYDKIHLSKQAKEMLDSIEDLEVRDYESHIHPDDLPNYKELVMELTKTLSTGKSIEYRYLKNGNYINIKEAFFPSFENGNILLYSLIDDISKEIEDKKSLYNLAYYQHKTGLATMPKLVLDLNQLVNTCKLSLAIFEIYDFKLYEELYGINFGNQLIYAIALELKRAFENEFNVLLYHLEFDRFAILYKEINDKRTIENSIFKAFDKVSKNLEMINSRVKLFFNCGIMRISKSSNIKENDKIILWALDALNDAKDIKTLEHHICHYDGELAKIRFNYNQLVTHISEAIDHGKIGLSYKQIVDIKNGEIFAYYTNISLDNFEVDNEFMQKVIKRRKLEELIDKYIISTASKEQKQLKENVHAQLFTIVPVSENSINDKLVSFIETQNNFYKTTKKSLIFLVQNANGIVIKRLKSLGYMVASFNIMDIYKKNIDFYIYDIKENGFENLDEIKKLCNDKDISLILSNVNEKEDLEEAIKHDINILYGDYYKKSIRMKKLINKLS